MPSNKQAQPLKPLIKTWTGWERGIGYLPESDEDETKGLYYADGVIGIHGELRPAPVLRNTTLKSHILRRLYHSAGNREAAAIALQIPNAVQGTQPTIKRIGSKNGTASSANAAEFFVGSFNKSTNNSAQTVTHNAGFTTKGAMFWSADGERTDGGTSTDVDETTLTVSGTPWTASEWINAVVSIPTSGGFGGTATITSNTTSILTFSGGWSSAGDPTDNTSVYTISWDATSKVGAGGMIGFADGTTSKDRSISWNAEDNSGDVPTEVVPAFLSSDSDVGTVDVISIHSTGSTEKSGSTPFNTWGPSLTLNGGKMNLVVLASNSAINNDAPTSFTLSGITLTLVKSITLSTTGRISLYRSAPSGTKSAGCSITWAVNQTDATIHRTTFNNVVTTGTDGADGIFESYTESDILGLAVVHLNPLNKTGNAMYGTILTNSLEGNVEPFASLGYTEIAEQQLDVGSVGDVQQQWRINALIPSNPTSAWSPPSLFGGVSSRMIACELVCTSDLVSSFTTKSYSPHSNRLVLLAIDVHREAGSVVAPTSVTTTSTTLSWTKVEDQIYDSSKRNISVWRALKTSGVSSGTDTIDFNSITQNSIRYIYTEYANVNLTVDGADAVDQSSDDAIASTNIPLTTLGSFGAAVNDATYGAHAVNNSFTMSARSGWVASTNETDDGSLMTAFREDNDTTVDANCTSGATGSIAIQIEFVAAGSGASNVARSYDNSCIHFVNEDAGGTFPSAVCTFTDGNNFSLAWSNNSSGTPTPTPDAINFILFGGTDVDTEVVEWTNDTGSTTTQEITGVSLIPTCLITIGALLTSQTTSTGIETMFGITDNTKQFAQNFTVTHGAEPSSSSRRTSKLYSVENSTGTETTVIENFDPSGGTGFTWRHTQAWSTGYKWATLAIKGVLAEVGQFTRESSSGGQAATSISITSDAFILTTPGNTQNDTSQGSVTWSMGAASELGEAACSAWTDETAQTATDNYALDWQRASTKTITNGEDTVWVELAADTGTTDAVAGVAKMDIGEADWLFLDGTDSDNLSGQATLINYVGFTVASNPKFATDSFNANSSDSNVEMIVAIASVKSGAVNSVIFNSTEALTKIIIAPDTTTYALELWHITNPSDSTATIVIDMASAVDLIVGIWLVEGASSSFGSGTFQSNDVDTNDYFSAGVAFNQPDVSLGQAALTNIDLILGISLDNSEVQDSGTKNAGVTYTSTGMTDTREALAINVYKGYTLTGTALKSSISVNTNTAILFVGHQPGWGNGTPVSGGGGSGDPWEISGTSVGSLENISFDEYKSTLHMVGTYLDTLYHKWQTHWYMEESIGTDDQYLYISRGRPGDANNTAPNVIDPPVIINKIDLRNSSTFGDDLGFVEFTDLTFPGQMARYKGNWFFPSSGTTNPRKLTVGTGNIDADTWPALTQATGDIKTVEHLANGAGTGGFQLVGMRAKKGWRETISEIASGIDVDPDTEAGWASYFAAGDRDERAAGLAAVGGGDVFINKDGLWSYYPDSGRSSLIFEDFKIWRSLFDNIPISPWRGGLLIPHPSGLLFWSPGQLPVNIGFDAKTKSYSDPPTNVINYNQGRYLGVVGVGDFIYTLYQPDITSSEINILCGYLHKSDQTDEIVWQVIGTTYLFDPSYNSNVGVSLLGKPKSASYETPTLWFNNGNNLSYIYLDDRAGPFRAIQQLTQSGFALLPELFFPERIDMSEMIIYTQGMRDGDAWQVSMIADNEIEINLGAPINRNGRNVIKINRHDVYRVMFKLTWSSSSNSEAPKVIGTDIATVDSGGSGVDTITSVASAFGDFIVGDEITITTTGTAGTDDGDYTLVSPVSAGTLSVATGSFTGVVVGPQVTIQSRHRESPAIKRIELYGQPTTRGASGGNE